MLRSYTAAGFDPDQFWGLSPRLYLAHMRGAGERLNQDHQNSAWLAWHIEALHRQKELPDLKQFMGGKAGQPAKQSPEVLRAMGQALAKAWGASEK